MAPFLISIWEELGRVERRERRDVPTWLHLGPCMPHRLKEDVGVQLDDESGELDAKAA